MSLHWVEPAELERLRTSPVPVAERVRLFADACRLNALTAIARAGSGHIGTSFSSVDIVAWLFLSEILPRVDAVDRPRYFSSKGHDVPALYAVLAGTGLLPFGKLKELRRLGGLPGHPDVGTSPFIEANTGSLGMGISKAKGMILADRLGGVRRRHFVLTGDGELQEGQFWESLQPAANSRLDELTVIVDHNKVQSDTLVERVSPLGDLEAKLRAFGWAVERCDGHDPDGLAASLQRLDAADGVPRIIIADTVKGRGVSFMEHTAMAAGDRLYRFHSGAPDAPVYERAAAEIAGRMNARLAAAGLAPLRVAAEEYPRRTAPDRPQRLVQAYGEALAAAADTDRRIVALDADLALDTGLLPFEKRHPERFVECGIAEQDMISTAGGLALRGLLPVAHSFACFLTTRPNEQIYNNATERTKVVYVGSLAGLVPGGPGHSHQSVRDIPLLASIPDLVCIEPGSEEQVRAALAWCLARSSGSSYLRLCSVAVELPFPPNAELVPGRGTVIREGADAVIFAYGPVMLSQAWQAAERLTGDGISLAVIDLPWLNRIDATWLSAVAGRFPAIFTLDDHYVIGGQGERLAALLAADAGARAVGVTHFGVRDIPVCGTNDEVLRHHGLDAASLAGAIRRSLRP